MDNRPIGIFDSGVGGLTVVRQVISLMPQEDIIYFGDTARLPYGTKPQETVRIFSEEITRFLIHHDVKAILIACNTATAASLPYLNEKYDVPIFGVIASGAEEAQKATKNHCVGLIATEGTVRSGAYQRKLAQLDGRITVTAQGCPLFVSMAEAGWVDNPAVEEAAKIYLKDIQAAGVDTLILGCTHFPLLAKPISRVMGDGVTLVDPALATAQKAKDYLETHDALTARQTAGSRTFYVSTMTDDFSHLCQIALGQSYQPEVVDLSQFSQK